MEYLAGLICIGFSVLILAVVIATYLTVDEIYTLLRRILIILGED